MERWPAGAPTGFLFGPPYFTETEPTGIGTDYGILRRGSCRIVMGPAMTPCTLSIRYGRQPVHESVAWPCSRSSGCRRLAGRGCDWGVPVADLTLYIVPNSGVDLRPLGVLVTRRRNRVRPSRRVIPFDEFQDDCICLLMLLSPPAATKSYPRCWEPASRLTSGILWRARWV